MGFTDTEGHTYYNLDPTPGAGDNNNIEARWYGYILIPGTGTTPVPVNFSTSSDDGSDLYIDGNLVVNNNNFQGVTQRTGLVSLTPGLHTIDVEYYQGGGGAYMDAQWDPTGGSNFVDIPNSAFAAAFATNNLTMAGSSTLTLANTNTYTGTTTVDSGTLLVTANGAMGPATAAGAIVESGADLAFSGNVNYTTATPVTLNGSGIAGTGAIDNLSGSNTFDGPITLSGSVVIGSTSGSLTLGSVTLGNLTVVGAGSTTLAGTLQVPSAGSITVNSSSPALTVSGTVNVEQHGDLNLAGSGTFDVTGTVTLQGGGSINMAGSGSANVSGSLNLSGTGTATLSDTGSSPLDVTGPVSMNLDNLTTTGSGNVNITGSILGGGFSSQILAIPSLTGYYPLNDAAGSTTVADDSSNDFPGTVMGGVTLGVPGAPGLGTAASFNGNGSGSDEIVVNSISNLFGTTRSSWTALAWVYVTSTAAKTRRSSALRKATAPMPTCTWSFAAATCSSANTAMTREVVRRCRWANGIWLRLPSPIPPETRVAERRRST